jgi:hypothetical protein
MNSRQRVLTAIRHQKPDRVPAGVGARSVVWLASGLAGVSRIVLSSTVLVWAGVSDGMGVSDTTTVVALAATDGARVGCGWLAAGARWQAFRTISSRQRATKRIL